jgi:hypothetical protein
MHNRFQSVLSAVVQFGTLYPSEDRLREGRGWLGDRIGSDRFGLGRAVRVPIGRRMLYYYIDYASGYRRGCAKYYRREMCDARVTLVAVVIKACLFGAI